jgi:hypothetical protein
MVSGLGTLGPYPDLSSSGSSVPMAPTQCSSADHDARLLVAETTISGTRFCDLPRRPGTDRPEHPTRIAVGLYFQRQAASRNPSRGRPGGARNHRLPGSRKDAGPRRPERRVGTQAPPYRHPSVSSPSNCQPPQRSSMKTIAHLGREGRDHRRNARRRGRSGHHFPTHDRAA